MRRIAVLLNGSIFGDSRVIKTIRTITSVRENFLDLFYILPNEKDKELFNDQVRLYPFNYVEKFRHKLIKHTFFYNEYIFFVKEVLNTGVKYDYVYANDLPCLKPAVQIKKKIGSKVIYDSHEIYVETINQFFLHGNFIKRIIFRLLIFFMKYVGHKAERSLLKKTDHFITVGEFLKSYFEKKYQFSPIIVIRNLPYFIEGNKKNSLHNLIGVDSSMKIAIYQGMLNPGRALFQMIESFRYVQKDIILCVLGRGALLTDLKKQVVIFNLSERVFFLDPVDSRDLICYTKSAICGLCLLEPFNLSCYYAAPNKLFEYIKAGIPIVASKTPECTLLLSEFQIGKLVDNDPKEIGNAINSIANEDAEFYQKECSKASVKYNWDNQEHLILGIFEERPGL